jgi:DNA-binding FadR family transcriptional regulator
MVASATDREGYAHADVEFHLAVYAASNNVLLRQFGSVVADFMYASFNVQQATAADDEVFLEDAATHAAVFEAINRGNGEKAAEAMLHVVLDGKNALIKALSDQRDGAVST